MKIKKLMKKADVILIITLLVSIITGTGLLSTADAQSAAPTITNVSPNTGATGGGTSVTITGTNFLPSSFNKTITISNSLSTLTNYQTNFTLDTASLIAAGKMRSDCGDLRVKDSDGTTDIPYWIDSGCNTGTTKVWTKIPSIPNGSKNIYVTYGDTSLTTTSSVANTFDGQISGLISSWNLDEASGTNAAADTSGNGYDATANSTTDVVSGRTNNARSFNGTSDYVSLPAATKTGLTTFSLDLWIKTTETGSSDTYWNNPSIIGDSTNAASSGDFGIITYHGYLGMWTGLNSSGDNSFNTTGNPPSTSDFISDNNWHHIVAVDDGSIPAVKLYLDGAVISTSSLPTGLAQDSYGWFLGAQHYYTGSPIAAFYHQGIIDEVHLYSTALTSTDVTNLYNNSTYTSAGDPGKVLIRKYASTEPSTAVGSESGAALQVTFGGVQATNVTYVSSTQITATTGAHAAGGTVDTAVTNYDGQNGTSSGLFTYVPPAITNINPTSGLPSGGTSVTITGTGFKGSSFQKPITITSSTALTNYQTSFTLDTASLIAAGKMRSDCGDLRVKNSDGTTDIPYWIESIAANACNTSTTKIWTKVPSIPNGSKTIYVTYGDTSLTSTASGTNTFDFFDDFNYTTSWTSGSPNSHGWTLETEGCTNGCFTAETLNGQLHILSTNSNTTYLTADNTSFTNFILESDVTPLDADSVRDENFVTRYTGNGDFYSEGSSGYENPNVADVYKRVGGNFTDLSEAGNTFTQNVPATWKTINNGSTLQFFYNGSAANNADPKVSWNDGSHSGSGKIGVMVDGNYGSSPDEADYDNMRVRQFTTTEPTTSVGSESGAALQVTIGGVQATNVVFVSPTQITATTGAHTAGTAVNVLVTNADGTSATLSNGFTYSNPPTVTSINPTNGTINTTVTVTIGGTNFYTGTGGPAVKISKTSQSDITCSNVRSVTSTSLICDLNLSTAVLGNWDLTVTNPDTQTATLAGSFSVTNPLTISSISPTSGSINGGTTVTVTGTNFAPGEYQKPITITNSGSTATNYQIAFTLDTASLIAAGKMKGPSTGDPCGDIRVKDSDNSTDLNYWVENCNSSSTKIWTKVPSIPNGSKTINVHYGNLSLTSNSSTTNTFIREIDSGSTKASWPMDEASGTTVNDQSGNNNNGTMNGTNASTNVIAGKFNNARNFNGSDNYFDAGNPASLQISSALSLEAWVKFANTSACYPRIISKFTNYPWNGYELLTDCTGTNTPYLQLGNNGTLTNVNSNSGLSANVWHHLVATYDGSTEKIYVDGVLTGTNSSAANAISVNGANSVNVEVGRFAGAAQQYFPGSIDEARIYNRALTAAEVTDLYNNYGYTTPNYQGKVLVRKFQGTVGNTQNEAVSANAGSEQGVGITVNVGGTAATNVVWQNSTTITLTAPAHASGLVGLSMVNGDGQTTNLPHSYTYVDARAKIISVNGGSSPVIREPFSVVVQATNANSTPYTVASDTNITLSVNTGTGSLSEGTYTGTILSGQNAVTITNVKYNKTENGVVLTATDTTDTNVNPSHVILTAQNSSAFNVGTGAAAFDANTTFSSSPGSVIADNIVTSSLTATLHDASNNPAHDKVVSVTKLSGTGTPTITAIPCNGDGGLYAAGTTDASGVACFTVRSLNADTFVFQATDTTDSLSAFSQTASVIFTPPTAADSTLTSDRTQGASNGSSTIRFTATLKDASSNVFPGRTVTLQRTDNNAGNPTVTAIACNNGDTPGVTNSTGQACFTVTSTTASSFIYRAHDNLENFVFGTPITITYGGGEIWANNGQIVAGAKNDNSTYYNTSTNEVVRDADGTYITMWKDDRNGQYGSIFAQKFNSSGTAQWSPANGVLVYDGNADSNAGIDGLRLITDDANGAFITWLKNPGASSAILAGKHVMSDGTLAWGSPYTAIANAQMVIEGNVNQYDVIKDGTGGLFLTYRDLNLPAPNFTGDTNHYRRVVNRLNSDGTVNSADSIGWPTIVTGGMVCDNVWGNLELARPGVVRVAFESADGSACSGQSFRSEKIHVDTLNGDSSDTLAQFIVSTSNAQYNQNIYYYAQNGCSLSFPYDQSDPVLVDDGQGGVYVIFKERCSSNVLLLPMFLNHIPNANNPSVPYWSTNFGTCTTDSCDIEDNNYVATSDNNHGIIIGWADYHIGSALQRFNDSGTAPNAVWDSGTPNQPELKVPVNALVSTASGGVNAIWGGVPIGNSINHARAFAVQVASNGTISNSGGWSATGTRISNIPDSLSPPANDPAPFYYAAADEQVGSNFTFKSYSDAVNDGSDGFVTVWNNSSIPYYAKPDTDNYIQGMNTSAMKEFNSGNEVEISPNVDNVSLTEKTQNNEKIVKTTNNQTVFVWQDDFQPTPFFSSQGTSIRAEKVDENGNLQWNPNFPGFGINVSEPGGINAASPTVTADQTNGIKSGSVIVGYELNGNGLEGSHDIWVQKIKNDGTPDTSWGNSGNGRQVATYTNTTVLGSPNIISDNNGGAYISWQANDDIYIQHIIGDANCTTNGNCGSGDTNWTGFIPRGRQLTGACCGNTYTNPKLLLNSNGELFIVYQRISASLDLVVLDKINPVTGSNIIEPEITGPGSGQFVTLGNAVLDSNNNLFVVYQIAASSSENDIYAQKFDHNLSMLWGGSGLKVSNDNSSGATNYLNPDVTSDNNGGAILTYEKYYDPASSFHNHGDIVVKRVSGTGAALWNETLLTNPADNVLKLNPKIVTDGSDGAVITWEKWNSGITASTVFSQHIVSGINQEAQYGFHLTANTPRNTGPQLIADNSGGATFSWERSGSPPDVYGQYYVENNHSYNSTFTASPTSLPGDGTTQSFLTATLLDDSNNPISGKTMVVGTILGDSTKTTFTNVDCTSHNVISGANATDINGQACFAVTSTGAGSYSFAATDIDDVRITIDQTADVTFTAGPVSGSGSTFTANPASVIADGTATSTLTATIKDNAGNPISGKIVTATLNAGPGNPTIGTIPCNFGDTAGVTNLAGQACFTVKSTTSGIDTFLATDISDGLGIAVAQTADVTFTPGSPAAAHSTFVANPGTVTADGTSTSTLTATVRDINGNHVPNANVSVSKTSVNSGTPTFDNTSTTTNSSGIATFHVSNTTQGTDTYAASLDDVSLASGYSEQSTSHVVPGSGGGTWTPITPSNNDDGTAPVSLPFSFTFFGQTYNTVYPCTNGYIQLINTGGGCSYQNSSFGSGDGVPRIAAYFQDLFLNTSSGGVMEYQTSSNEIRFHWKTANYPGNGAQNHEFEIDLFNDNTIQIHYNDSSGQTSNVIGIDSGTASSSCTVTANCLKSTFSGTSVTTQSTAFAVTTAGHPDIPAPNPTVTYTGAATVSSINPNHGTTLGGTFVTITGTNFASSSYQRQITINNTGSALSNYQESFQLDTASLISANKMRSDCGDIRVKNSDGTTDLPYWFDPMDCNTATTTVWTKIPSIPNGSKTIYVDYGDTSLTSQSNGTNVFEFFDDFNTNDFGNVWQRYDFTDNIFVNLGSPGHVYIDPANSRAVLDQGDEMLSSGSPNGYQMPRPNIFETKAEATGAVDQMMNTTYWASPLINFASKYWSLIDAGIGSKLRVCDPIGNCPEFGPDTSFSPQANTWYINKLALRPNGTTTEIDSTDGNALSTTSTSDISLTNGYIGLDAYFGGNTSYFSYYDWVRVRKYAATEPNVSLGSELGFGDVKFDGIPATNVEVVNSTTITANTPAHAAGVVDVLITNPDGTNETLPGSYTYISLPPESCGFTKIAGAGSHSLGLETDGTVWAWGVNQYGQLGNGNNTDSNVPVQVKDPSGTGFLTGITAIAGNGDYSMALKNDGTVWTWGHNGQGQLGNGNNTDSNVPVQVLGPGGTGFLTGITAIAGGFNSSMALKNDGTVWTWGYNNWGQLGTGNNTDSNVPVQVKDSSGSGYLTGITAIAGGADHSMALDSSGNVWTWGHNNNGELGNGTYNGPGGITYIGYTLPVQVVGPGGSGNLTGITAIAAGSSYSTALKNDGTVWAWGWNSSGQLGNGNNDNSNVPVQVEGLGGSGYLTGITAIAAGGDTSIALKNDGTVLAWGIDNSGELGDGNNTNSNVPVQVKGPGGSGYLTGITAIAGGGNTSIALKPNGTVWTWGINSQGQLGNGTNTSSNIPVQVVPFVCITPNTGPTAGGTSVTITGANFATPAGGAGQPFEGTVTFGGTTATSVTFNSSTSLTAIAPAHTFGPVDVVVTNPDSQSATFTSGFTYIAPPPTTCGFIQISGGSDYSTGLKNDGTVWEWGSNNFIITSTSVPVQVSGLPSNIIAVSGGTNHALALDSNGNVWAWGYNFSGELGDGTTNNSLVAVPVSNLTGVKAIAGGDAFSMALKNDGTVWAWGDNAYGELGNGSFGGNSSVPTPVLNLSGITAISGGVFHGLALDGSGNVWAWGENNAGQLGDGTTTQRNTPVQVSNLTGVTAISAGYGQSLAIDGSRNAWAWGKNNAGELGDGTTNNSSIPVQVSNLTGVTAISAGYGQSLAIDGSRNAWAWGDNSTGELGDGTTNNSSIPVQVSNLTNVISIATGENFSLAVENNSTAWAWGDNSAGTLGNGNNTNSTVPVETTPFVCINPVSGPSTGHTHVTISGSNFQAGTIVKFDTSNATNIAVSGDGKTITADTPPHAAGAVNVSITNPDNQLATLTNGFTYLAPAPQPCGYITMDAGYHHTLAVKSDGTVWAWGFNNHGELGDGTTTGREFPVQVSGLTNVIAVAANTDINDGFSLALKSDGTVWAWGANSQGELGDGTNTERHTPVQISSLSGMTAIVAGGSHSLAIKNDGTVWAWGGNLHGPLGDGTTNDSNVPVQVSGLTNVTKIAAGLTFSLAVKNDGTAWGWGVNDEGQLGDGTNTERLTPVQITALSGINDISAGTSHGLAVDNSGNVWTWGRGLDGELGNGSSGNLTTPTEIGLTGVTQIAGGRYFSMALMNDGTVQAWGDDSAGQLGDGTTNSTNSPNPVPGLSGVTAIDAGQYYSLALLQDGSLQVWGSNDQGQFGNGTLTDSSTPTPSSLATCINPPQGSALGGTTVVISGENFQSGATVTFGGTPATVNSVTSTSINVTTQAHPAALVDVIVTNPDLQFVKYTNGFRYLPGPNYCQATGFTKVTGAGEWGGIGLKSDGTVWAFGGDNSRTAVQISGLSGITAVSGGNVGFTLALKNDGTVYAWGVNFDGTLGNGTNTNSNTPVQVSGLTGITAIAAGYDHALALKNDGTVYAWGNDTYGQLGNGTTGGSSNVPVQISGLTGITAIAAGGNESLAFNSNDGTVWGWGYIETSNVPVQVTGLSNVTAIAGGAGTNGFALESDGTVWAWGDNTQEELGNGTNGFSLTPVQVTDPSDPSGFLQNVATIAGGSNFASLAIKNDGTVWSWGYNQHGELGNGSNGNSYHAVEVVDPSDRTGFLQNVSAIGGAQADSYAVKNDGSVWAWGDNEHYGLGDGITNGNGASFIPVPVSGGSACIVPTQGPTIGGTHVTISGSNFQTGASVKFDGLDATNIVVASDHNSLTADTPPHAAGTVNVVVTNPDLQSATLYNGFTYTNNLNSGGSTVVAFPTSVPNDNTTASRITVTLRDATNSPIQSATVTVAKTAGQGTPTITPVVCPSGSAPAGTTNPVGEACFDVTSGTIGLDTFQATDVTDSTVIPQTANIEFTCASGTPGSNAGSSGEQCGVIGITNGGSLSITKVPDDFTFPATFAGGDTFNNGSGPDNGDRVIVSDTRNTAGFTLQLQASTPFADTSNPGSTIPLTNLYTTTSTVGQSNRVSSGDSNATAIACDGIEYLGAAYTSASDCSGVTADINAAFTILSGFNNVANYTGLSGNTVDSAVDLMQTSTAHNGSFSQLVNYYLHVPSDQSPGNYQVTLTFTAL